ncbi:MAG: 2OG-Fe(II) oxygenase [Rhodanobacter sp.]
MKSADHEFTGAANALAADGWYVLPNLMVDVEIRALADECAAMHDAKLLLPARTGATRKDAGLRGDSTHWFANGAMSEPQQMFTDRLDTLRLALSRTLTLGLVDCESHYAVYRPGASYARHRDCLRDNDARVLSCVFYLNEHWQQADGGALRLYLADGTARDIYPHAGSLLLFLSTQFEHEVLPATRDRMSIASWMRQRRFDSLP